MPKYLGVICALQIVCTATAFGQGSSANAWKACQSSDADERLRGCTAVINANGFGSQNRLADALDGRCWAYHVKEQFSFAIKDCKASIRIRPRHFYAFNNLGTAYAGLGEYENAVAAFNIAIELNPEFYWSRFNRAKALVALGEIDNAIKDYEYILNRNPANQDVKNRLHQLRIATQPPSPSPREQPPSSNDAKSGTGFYVSDDGYLITNQHVGGAHSAVEPHRMPNEPIQLYPRHRDGRSGSG
jgi:tetratricopeptide (TPR) repeat protein